MCKSKMSPASWCKKRSCDYSLIAHNPNQIWKLKFSFQPALTSLPDLLETKLTPCTLQSNPMWSYWCYDACMVNPHWSQREILNLLYTSGFIVSHSQLFLFLSGFGISLFLFSNHRLHVWRVIGSPSQENNIPQPTKISKQW